MDVTAKRRSRRASGIRGQSVCHKTCLSALTAPDADCGSEQQCDWGRGLLVCLQLWQDCSSCSRDFSVYHDQSRSATENHRHNLSWGRQGLGQHFPFLAISLTNGDLEDAHEVILCGFNQDSLVAGSNHNDQPSYSPPLIAAETYHLQQLHCSLPLSLQDSEEDVTISSWQSAIVLNLVVARPDSPSWKATTDLSLEEELQNTRV